MNQKLNFRIVAQAIIFSLALVMATSGAMAAAGDYNSGDIAVVNAMRTANGLNWPAATANGDVAAAWMTANWPGVEWTADATNKRIRRLDVINKNLSGTLNISGLASLEILDCYSNTLMSINRTGLTNIRLFHCHKNKLTSLDASGLPFLENLFCSDNLLTSIDLSGSTYMQIFDCNNNFLESIDVSACADMQELYCSNNYLTSLALNASGIYQFLDVSNNYLPSKNAVTGKTINWNELNLAFSPQHANPVTGIAIKNQPIHLVQGEGYELFLSGLSVTLAYSKGPNEDVNLSSFAAKNIGTYIGGAVVTDEVTVLSYALHNGKPITVSCNGHNADTNPLTIAAQPVFNPQPASQSITAGETASFTVGATIVGSGSLAYQWYASSDGGLNWQGISHINWHFLGFDNGTDCYSGDDTPTLTLKNVPASMNGYQFRCQAANWVGGSGVYYYTNPATLTVTVPLPTTYAVTVNGGTGGGNYAAGATVGITADAPAAGKEFDCWTTTDGVTFADATNPSTSFTMPAKAVTVTATYRDATTYTVTVNGGTGGGSYAAGAKVSITATVPAGKAFDGWTTDDGITFTDAGDPSTSFTMPAHNVTVKAEYRDVYLVTVNSGYGGGYYEAGATAYIIANNPLTGKVFDRWTTDDAGVTFLDAADPYTSFTVPAHDVTVTAGYRDVTGNEALPSDGLRAYVENGVLHVGGIAAGQTWRVYTITGALVYAASPSSSEHLSPAGSAGAGLFSLPLSTRGVHIVTDGRTAVKVVN